MHTNQHSTAIVLYPFFSHAHIRPHVTGSTKQWERDIFCNQFLEGKSVNTILFTRTGDESVNLPNANVVIEASYHHGANNQEFQRMGMRTEIKQLPKQTTNQANNQPTNQPTNQSTNQPIKQPTNQPNNQPIKQPINQSTDQPINQPTNQTTKPPLA